MTPQMFRLVVGFLAAFVLLSIAPGLMVLLGQPGVVDRLGDLLLFLAAGLSLSAGAVVLWRHRIGRWMTPRRSPGGSDLAFQIRQAARRGARGSDLARKYRVSQDAVRLAIGREASPPAGLPGSSFRSRQPALPLQPRAHPALARRSAYRASA